MSPHCSGAADQPARRGYAVGHRVDRAATRSAMRRGSPRTNSCLISGCPLDGADVIRELRGWSPQSRHRPLRTSQLRGQVGALDAGADDYVTKPFNMQALLARLRAALRRGDHPPDGVRFSIGRCEIDLTAHTIVRNTGPVTDARSPAEPRRPHLSRFTSPPPSGGCSRSC